jgi:hypothetical protein
MLTWVRREEGGRRADGACRLLELMICTNVLTHGSLFGASYPAVKDWGVRQDGYPGAKDRWGKSAWEKEEAE